MPFLGWRILHHRLPGPRAEDQPFEQGIACQPVGSVHARCGRLSRGIQTGQGSPAPQVGLHAAHHVVRRGANRRNVGRQIQTVAQARFVDSREPLLQKFLALLGHVQIDVLAVRAMHLSDDRSRYNIP